MILKSLLWLVAGLISTSVAAGGHPPPLDREGRMVFPILVAGDTGDGYFQTTLTLVNLSTRAAQGDVRIFDNQGGDVTSLVLCPLSGIQGTFRLEGQGTTSVVTRGRVQDLAGPVLDGYAVATWSEAVPDPGPGESSAPHLQGSAEVTVVRSAPEECPERPFPPAITRPSTEIPTTVQIPSLEAGRLFRAPAAIASGRQTAVAVVNASSGPRKITFTLLDTSGELFEGEPPRRGEITYELEPGERVAAFVWELLHDACRVLQRTGRQIACPAVMPPDPPELFYGSVMVAADGPIVVTAIDVLHPEGRLVNGPVHGLEPVAETSAQAGEEFSLRLGQSAWIEDETLQITFTEVAEDSRCPSDAICIWPGQVSVVLHVTPAGGAPRRVVLTSVAGEPAGEEVGDFTIQLKRVEPYPQSPGRIPDSRYVIYLEADRNS